MASPDPIRPRSARGVDRRHPPHAVADVVGDEQRTRPIHRNADRATARIAVRVDEAGQHVLGRSGRLAVARDLYICQRDRSHFGAAL
jgi:hypothetical protein